MTFSISNFFNVRLRRAACWLILVSLIFSCSDTETGPSTEFDRALMLENMADQVILPRLNSLQQATNSLDASINVFVGEPTLSSLETAQASWRQAALVWQANSAFGFGPGDLTLGPIGAVFGTFPADVSAIESAIAEQDFTLDNFDRDVRGFYAVEYLLFGIEEENQSILSFYLKTNSNHHLAYLKAVSDDLSTSVNQVVNSWESGYRDTFVSNDGTSAGSSTSQLFNAFSQDFEVLKNFKVALPSGKRPGQAGTEASKVEAYYSGLSSDLLIAHFNALVNIWEGGDGLGFREYLESVEGGGALVESTQSQILSVEQALSEIEGDNLALLIEQDNNKIENLNTELQKLTRFFKSDMSSLLGIAITFNSGDGD